MPPASELSKNLRKSAATSCRIAPGGTIDPFRRKKVNDVCASDSVLSKPLICTSMPEAVRVAFAESIVGQGEERQLAMQPSRLSEFITLVRERFEEAARQGENPVLVTSPGIRPFVRSIVERFRSQTVVLSQSEIHPRARLKTVGSI